MVLQIVLIVGVAWVAVSVLLALFIGRAVRLADRRQRQLMATTARRPAPRPVAATRPRALAKV